MIALRERPLATRGDVMDCRAPADLDAYIIRDVLRWPMYDIGEQIPPAITRWAEYIPPRRRQRGQNHSFLAWEYNDEEESSLPNSRPFSPCHQYGDAMQAIFGAVNEIPGSMLISGRGAFIFWPASEGGGVEFQGFTTIEGPLYDSPSANLRVCIARVALAWVTVPQRSRSQAGGVAGVTTGDTVADLAMGINWCPSLLRPRSEGLRHIVNEIGSIITPPRGVRITNAEA